MRVWPALSLIACTSLLPVVAQTKPAATPATSDMARQELARFEKRVTVKVLPNGLTVLLIERPEAPVFSYFTLVDAGDANDPTGQSGLAHMFEHLAFKGTEEIGTKNWPAEKVALQKVEDAYAAYDAEYRKRVGQDPAKLKQLREAFDAAKKDAQQYVVPNQFTEIAEENGTPYRGSSTKNATW
jgi:predicted Zn-dependent peptidase